MTGRRFADTILFGDVVTLDGKGARAEAIAVAGERIAAVGSSRASGRLIATS